MPWLSIIMALIAFLTARKGDSKNNTRAAVAGVAAGLGTYYVTHETDWGKENLGQFDGVVSVPTSITTPGEDGTTTTTIGGKPAETVTSGGMQVTLPTGSSQSSFTDGMWRTLQTWGPLGTATVVGAGTAGITGNKKWLWIAGGAVVLLLLMK